MPRITLSPRLLAAAAFVRGGALIDVGTDHAYLPVYLMQNGIIERAVACDVAKMPLQNAAETVKLTGFTEKIQLRLSDGLDAVSPDEADEIVFAGMGGTLICRLLSRAYWLKNASKHLIFQPQSRAEELRAYLYDNGFEILGEKAVFEGRRVYLALHAVYTGKTVPRSPGYAYIGRLAESLTPAAAEYLRHQENRLIKKRDGAFSQGDEQAAEALTEILTELRGVLHG